MQHCQVYLRARILADMRIQDDTSGNYPIRHDTVPAVASLFATGASASSPAATSTRLIFPGQAEREGGGGEGEEEGRDTCAPTGGERTGGSWVKNAGGQRIAKLRAQYSGLARHSNHGCTVIEWS